MTITDISVTYGGKLNLGDYNSVHIELTASALLDENDDPDQALSDLFAFVKTQVRAQAAELAKKKGTRVDEIFAGLPVEVRQSIQE